MPNQVVIPDQDDKVNQMQDDKVNQMLVSEH
jgi:hypothetical protein